MAIWSLYISSTSIGLHIRNILISLIPAGKLAIINTLGCIACLFLMRQFPQITIPIVRCLAFILTSVLIYGIFAWLTRNKVFTELRLAVETFVRLRTDRNTNIYRRLET